MLDGPDGKIYAVWITTRLPGDPVVAEVRVWPGGDLSDVRHIPAQGYSVPGQAVRDGRYLLAWVRTISGSNHDYFYRILDSFEFSKFEKLKLIDTGE